MCASSRVRRFAAACALVSQLATAAVALTALAAGPPADVADDCSCQTMHGDQPCPMHHNRTADATTCRLICCGDRGDAASVVALFGPIGVMPAAVSVAHGRETATLFALTPALPRLPSIPDSPPPRS